MIAEIATKNNVTVLHVDEATKRQMIADWRERGAALFVAQQPLESCANQYERAGWEEALRDWIWRQEWNSAEGALA